MKKLMTMIAAVATAFGLFADEPTTYNGNSFETQAEGVTDNTWSPDGEIWTSDITDPFDLGIYNTETDPKYGYPTTKVSTNTRRDTEFEGGATNLKYLKLDTGSATVDRTVADGQVFFDQVIKFTGFEDMQTNFTAGTKIALWTSAIEDDEDTDGVDEADTNLYVAVGTANSEAPIRNLKIDVGDDFDFNAWHRVTIKNAGAVSGNYLGFFVWIDGEMATIDGGKLDYFAGDLTNHESYYDKGQLFISMDGTSATVANIGFQGVGSLDDVVVDAQGPAFAVLTVDVAVAPIDGAVIEVWQNDAKIAADASTGKYTLDPGDYTVKYTAAPGWILKAKDIAHNTSEGDVDDSEEIIPEEGVIKLTHDSVDTYYTQEQFEAMLAGVPPAVVVDGDVITVVKAIDKEDEFFNKIYSFTPDTTITIQDVKEESTVVAVKWIVNIPDYDEGTTAGSLAFNLGLAAEKQIEVEFTGTLLEDAWVDFSGEIAAGASFELKNGSGAGDIKLMSDTSVVTVPADAEFEVAADEGLELNADTTTKEGFVIYTAEPEATTWEATIDLVVGAGVNTPTAKVNGEGEAVDISTGKCEVPAGSTLVVTYTLQDGYKTDDDLVQTLTASAAASKAPVATAIEYTITYNDAEFVTGFEPTTSYTIVTPTFQLPGVDDVEGRSGGEFKGWTNEVGDTVTEVKVGTTGNLAFYAVWEQAGTDEVAEEIKDKVADVPEGKETDVRNNMIAINEACGSVAEGTAWITKIYGDAKIPGEKLAATDAELIAMSVAYDLPIVTEEPTATVVAAESTDGAPAFEFTITADDDVSIDLAKAKVQKIVKYSSDLATDEFDASTADEVKITVDKAKSNVMKAEFVAGPTKGFMKADFTVAK